MPLTDAEWSTLRAMVSAEPAGSPAHALLAEVDRLIEERRVRDEAETAEKRKQFIAGLKGHEYRTEADATRFVDTKAKPEFEMGPCRACDGKRNHFVPGCIGGRWEKCRKCNGKGKRSRLRLPWAPEGEVVDPLDPAVILQETSSDDGDVG